MVLRVVGPPETSSDIPRARWGPELCLLHLQTLLREVQTLRDRLCTEDEASSCATAQRLLQVYRQLRHPSLILL